MQGSYTCRMQPLARRKCGPPQALFEIPMPGGEAFQHFRILQTGPNQTDNHRLTLSGFEVNITSATVLKWPLWGPYF